METKQNVDSNVSSILSNLSSQKEGEELIKSNKTVDKNIEKIFSGLSSDYNYENMFGDLKPKMMSNKEKLKQYAGEDAFFVGDIEFNSLKKSLEEISKKNNIEFKITKKSSTNLYFKLSKKNTDKVIEIEISKSGNVVFSFIVDIEEIKKEEKKFVDNNEFVEYINKIEQKFDKSFIIKLDEQEKENSNNIDYDYLRLLSFELIDLCRKNDWDFLRDIDLKHLSFIILFDKMDLKMENDLCEISLDIDGKLSIKGTYDNNNIDKTQQNNFKFNDMFKYIIECLESIIKEDFKHDEELELVNKNNINNNIEKLSMKPINNQPKNINLENDYFLSKPDVDWEL